MLPAADADGAAPDPAADGAAADGAAAEAAADGAVEAPDEEQAARAMLPTTRRPANRVTER
jgi:hypothetical protein